MPEKPVIQNPQLEDEGLIYVAQHPTLPGYCAAFFFEDGDETALIKAFKGWRKLGYKAIARPVDTEEFQRGSAEFLKAKKSSEQPLLQNQ